jgi:cholesterol transport system auxiliary component
MNRRHLLLTPLLLGACSVLPERPYAQRRDWPMTVQRPTVLPAKRGGPVLLVRSVAAAPGLEDRGLHALQPDGSMAIAYYEQWISPPALALEQALRQWLSGGGVFAAVLPTGSRLDADYVLETELTALWTNVTTQRAVAGLAYSILEQRGSKPVVRAQRALSASAAVTGPAAPALVDAQCRALADICAQLDSDMAAFR